MIRNYSIYELNRKEIVCFYSAGYSAIAFLFFLFYHNVILSLAAGVLIIKLRPFYEKHMAARRMEKLSNQFKDMLYSLSASVASGRQMSEAVIEACDTLQVMYSDTEPIMVELNHMKKSMLENNESDRVLLADFARRSSNEDINNFVSVYTICRSMGGDLERIILHTSEILTDKMNIDKEIRTITAQKKFEGRLVALMPVVMLLVLNILSPSYVAPLYEGFIGKLIMTGCIGVTACGVWMMERISDIEI